MYTEKDNVEDLRPSKKKISVTLVGALLLGFIFIATGVLWFID